MWFEVLPSAAVIYVALSIPTISMYVLHRTFLGNAYRRDLRQEVNQRNYVRDWRLTNNPYNINLLEVIPDE